MKLKRKIKCIIAFILCITISIGAVPQIAYAMPQSSNAEVTKEYKFGNVICTYRETSSWGNYVNAEVTVVNNGEEPVYNWSVSFDYNGNIDNIWNADIIENGGTNYVIKSKDYNAVIRPGSSAGFGFISHGENEKPSIPEKINVSDENGILFSEATTELTTEAAEDTESGTTESKTTTESETTTENNNQKPEDQGDYEDSDIGFPDRLNALNYAVLSADKSAFNINANQLKVSGNVHTNGGFTYSGTGVEVNGKLEAVKTIKLNTSSEKNAGKIGEKIENASYKDMPDILDDVYNYAKEIGEYKTEYVTYNAEDIALGGALVTDSGAGFNGTNFLNKGIIYAKDSISYNVNSFATPSGARLLIVSENGDINISGSDININAVLYAPNGTVNLNVNSLNLNGRIIAKKINMNGTNLNINAGPYDYEMIKFLYKPELLISEAGNLKENRKVTLDVIEKSSTKFLNNCTSEWKIEKAGDEPDKQAYAVDESASTATHRELTFREAGTYIVTVTVKSKKDECVVTKEVVISKDAEPKAGIFLSEKNLYRNEKGIATLTATDKSVSFDGDDIVSRKWYLFHDADNNGQFEAGEKKLLNDAGKNKINIEVKNVGKYKVVLEIREGFEDKIESLTDDSIYKTASAEETFEVGNKKPTASVSLEKAKKADLVFTVGDCSGDQLELYNQKAEEIRARLEAEGVDVRIDTVSTKALTAQDSFAWKEFSHTDYGFNHIQYNDNGIKMIGNDTYPVRDFLYVPSDNAGKKTFSFDLQRDGSDWHSMEGGGFLFNSTVDEANNTIKGFCVLITNGYLKLVKIDCKNLNGFRNNSYSLTQHAGQLLTSAELGNVYDKHHIKVLVDNNTVSVWDGDEIKIDGFVLPENDYGYGFGPITCHISHACSQLSYFTFNNILMESMEGTSLADIVEGYDWRSDAERYVFNLSNSEIPELMTDEDMAETAAALIKTDTVFVGLGNEKNENQYKQLINVTDGRGIYHANEETASCMDAVSDVIDRSVNSKDYRVKDMITKDVTIVYRSVFADEDGDELYEQEWEYEYDPSIFGKTTDGETKFIRSGNEPLTQFAETGAYVIRLKVRDNPFNKKNDEFNGNESEENESGEENDGKPEHGTDTDADKDALDEYRLWSDTAENDKLLIVQSRPVAELKVDVTDNPADKTKCNVNVTYNAYDEDHMDDKTKGIREEIVSYKKINDAEWTEGRFPNEISIGDTYIIKYQVKDAEGTWSFPATCVVKTKDCRKFEETADENPPRVVIVPEKSEIAVGEEIIIDAYAEDDFGISEFELYINDESVMSHTGRIRYKANKEGIIRLKGKAKDIGGNTDEAEITIKAVDKSDKVPPTAVITSPLPESDIDFGVVEIRGTAKDETAFEEYTLSYKAEDENEYHIFASGKKAVDDDKLGELDITKLKEGKYIILLTSKDKSGNEAYYAIGLNLETGQSSTEYELTCEITEVSYDKDKGKININGTAKSDGDLGKYTLSVRYEDGEEKVLAEGTDEKNNELLATMSTDNMESGTYHLKLRASNSQGDEVEAEGSFVFKKGSSGNNLQADMNPPDAKITDVKLTDNKTYINIVADIKDDKAVKEWSLSYAPDKEDAVFEELASGTDAVNEAVIGTINVDDMETGEYRLRLIAYDECKNSCIYTAIMKYAEGQGVEVEDSASGGSGEEPEQPSEKEKELAVNISKSKAKPGETVQVNVTLPEGYKEEELVIYLNDKELAKGVKKTSFKAEKLGENTVKAKLSDKEAIAKCFVYDEKDTKQPTVEFTSPYADTAITKPTDISGSAYDEEGLESYKLEYRLEGTKDEDYVLIAEGKKDIKNSVIGKFDPTLLPNGRYEIKLTATDKGGNTANTVRTVMADGKLKVGVMNIGFNDITNKLSGITVNVNRMYTSLNKDTSGDFGYGWTLGLSGMRIFKAGNIETGYAMRQSGGLFSTKYQMVETEKHDLVISYGDGTSDRFVLTFNPEMSSLVPIMETKIGYRCVTNPKIKLEIAGDSTAYVTGDSLIFYDEAIYDSVNYKLTTEDGNEIYINDKTGVYQMASRDGNVIVVDKNGYHSQDGKSITLERDSKNRITKATDIHGKTTGYAYDKDGNLASVTTDDGRSVSYTYDNNHNLISITDPNGVAVARNEYDENGRLIATIDADGNRIEYEPDVEGRTQAVKDRRGYTTVYTYDDNGNIIKTVDALGNVSSATYDKYGNVLSRKDENGNITEYSYDANGNMIKVVAPDGSTVESSFTQENYLSGMKMLDKTIMALQYDRFGNIAELEDSNGNITSYEYENNNLISITDSIGTYEKYTYDADGNILTEESDGKTSSYKYNSLGQRISAEYTLTENGQAKTISSYFSYDDSGNMVQSTDGQGNVITYAYDANGNNIRTTDSKNRSISYEYDDLGNVIKITYPDASVEEFTYDAEGNNISATNRNGTKCTMTYDGMNRVTKKEYSNGVWESYSYDAVGNLIKEANSNGATKSYEYNNRNLNTKVTDTYGNETTYEYDGFARLIKVIDTKGNTTSYTYDNSGNVLEVTYADGRSSKTGYDKRNRIVSQEDPEGNRTVYEYDENDRLIAVVDAELNRYEYVYDENGNVTKITDPLKNETKYTYDLFGNILSIENALGHKQQFVYDSTGTLLSHTDYNGVTEKYIYDENNVLVEKKTGDKSVKYNYDNNRLKSVVEGDDITSFEYDDEDRLISKTDVNGNTISYNYDNGNRLIAKTVLGKTTEYEYDKTDRITRVVDHQGNITIYEYDSLGNRSKATYSNGLVMTYSYDECQRLTEECLADANGRILAKYSYSLGKNGERLSVKEVTADGTVIEKSYKYDKLLRLTKEEIKVNDSKLANEYSYDAVSNRTEKNTVVSGKISDIAKIESDAGNNSTGNSYVADVVEGKTTYSYNAINQLITETRPDGVITYIYDKNGNLVKKNGLADTVYTYDKCNNLVSVHTKDGTDELTENYRYDYSGNRLSCETNGEYKEYIIDDISGLSVVNAILYKDSSDNVKETYLYTLNATERLNVCITNGGSSEKSYVYHIDSHGDVRALTDEKCNITDCYFYDSYGKILKANGNTKNEFLYTGEQYSEISGLYYLRARYMDPSIGRFVSMDSYQGDISDPLSLHKYLYANANPVDNCDPTGYMTISETSVCLGCAAICATAVIGMRILVDARLNIRVTDMQQTVKAWILSEILYAVSDDAAKVDAIAEVDEKVREKLRKKDGRRYTVYAFRGRDDYVVRYVGRTKSYNDRFDAHNRPPKGKIYLYDLREFIRIDGLTYEESRGMEAILISRFGTLNPTKNEELGLYNFVRGIGPNSNYLKRELYMHDTYEYLQNNIDSLCREYPSLAENLMDEARIQAEEELGIYR